MGVDHISIQVPRPVQPKARYALRQLSIVLGITAPPGGPRVAASPGRLNLVKGLVRWNATSLTMFKDGFAYLRRPNENPLFGFPGWRHLEAPRSAWITTPHELTAWWNTRHQQFTTASQYLMFVTVAMSDPRAATQ
jgi:hypothetical protein